jgi:hypothetical protein
MVVSVIRPESEIRMFRMDPDTVRPSSPELLVEAACPMEFASRVTAWLRADGWGV